MLSTDTILSVGPRNKDEDGGTIGDAANNDNSMIRNESIPQAITTTTIGQKEAPERHPTYWISAWGSVAMLLVGPPPPAAQRWATETHLFTMGAKIVAAAHTLRVSSSVPPGVGDREHRFSKRSTVVVPICCLVVVISPVQIIIYVWRPVECHAGRRLWLLA